jgi:fibronectin type III domain protein
VSPLYKAGSDSRQMRELKGFERVTLRPGEKKDVWVGADSMATLSAGFTVVC